MKKADVIPARIFTLPKLLQQVTQWKFLGKTIAFTNGVFDILHPGHIYSLSAAASEADILIIGLNSDPSVRRLKGHGRPVNNQEARSILLASLIMVDALVVFDEDTPIELIKAIRPDVLVKGGDYSMDKIVGAGEVMSYGGRVVINPVKEGFSTTSIIGSIREKS